MRQAGQDQWAQWVLQRQFGGDQQAKGDFLKSNPLRDKVLDNAKVVEGNVLLDVGCGSGLIAFGALERIGEHGAVIFSDISQDLLDHCQLYAQELGVIERCRFLRASADDLGAVADGTVDVVTTRSVLIYVQAKQAAFQEFYRVLKPGGRLSIFEPINRFGHPQPPNIFWGYDVTPVVDLAAKVRALYECYQNPKTDPMLDFDERDLLNMAEQAGFGNLRLELNAGITPHVPQDWDLFLHRAANPLIPTMAEAIQEALTLDETVQFAAHLRPLVETGQGTARGAIIYLWALKD